MAQLFEKHEEFENQFSKGKPYWSFMLITSTIQGNLYTSIC